MLGMMKTFLARWFSWIVGSVILFLLGSCLTLFLLLKGANTTIKDQGEAYQQLSATLTTCSTNNKEYRDEIEYLKSVIVVMKDSHENIEKEYDSILDEWNDLNSKTCVENKGGKKDVTANESSNPSDGAVDYSEHFRLLREAGCRAGADCL